mgnify:FL=1
MFKKLLYYTFVAGMVVSMSSCSILQGKKDDKSASKPPKKESKNGVKPYAKIITSKAKSDKGLFTVHQVDQDYFFEIPDSLFNREMLMVTRIAQTAQGIGFGGGKQNEQVLRWQKKGDNVYLRVVSYDIAAADSLPINEAVVNSNFEPILYSFKVKAYKKDSVNNNTVINVNDLFEKDVKAIGLQSSRRSPYKISRLDASRSYIDTIRSYPENIEIRHVKTYNAGNPPSNSSTGSVSLKFSNSMVLYLKSQ